MRVRLGYFSFILAFFLCTALMFVFLAQARADASPDRRAFLVEKRYYAISDMEYAMYQSAKIALGEAKDEIIALRAAKAGVEPETLATQPLRSLSDDERLLAKQHVLSALDGTALKLKSIYEKDYDAVFWCGPLASYDRPPVLAEMLKTVSAKVPIVAGLAPDYEFSQTACMDYVDMSVGADGSLVLDFSATGATFHSKTPFGDVGIGLSVYDPALNQSSVHQITRLNGLVP